MPRFPASTRRWAACVLVTLCPGAGLRAQEAIVLTRPEVIRLAQEHAPDVRVARARADETGALRTGAGALATVNPDLALTAGPYNGGPGQQFIGYSAVLTWPFDIAGSRGVRLDAADARAAVADAEVRDAARRAVGQALRLWIRAVTAQQRVVLEQERTQLDGQLVHVAEVRRAAGTAGDGDWALARVMHAEGLARLRNAEGAQRAVITLLMQALGLPDGSSVKVDSLAEDATPPALDVLLQGLGTRPDLVRATANVQADRLDATLQKRIGFPIPRLTLEAGRNPDFNWVAGVDFPLPIYQRNQTNAAVAEARALTSAVQQDVTRAQAVAELRAAFATYEGAAAAYDVLREAAPAIDDAEHLALRGYELGQATLAQVVVARREATGARAALLDAAEACHDARLALDLSAGTLP